MVDLIGELSERVRVAVGDRSGALLFDEVEDIAVGLIEHQCSLVETPGDVAVYLDQLPQLLQTSVGPIVSMTFLQAVRQGISNCLKDGVRAEVASIYVGQFEPGIDPVKYVKTLLEDIRHELQARNAGAAGSEVADRLAEQLEMLGKPHESTDEVHARRILVNLHRVCNGVQGFKTKFGERWEIANDLIENADVLSSHHASVRSMSSV